MVDFNVLVNIGVILLLMIGLIVAMGLLSKKYKLFTPVNGEGMRFISGTTIGRKNRLVLVQVYDKKLLLGVSDQQISTLCVFENEEQSPQLKVAAHE